MSRIFLHVGMQKTGTTFLQDNVFSHDVRINSLAGNESCPGPLWRALEDLAYSPDWTSGPYESDLSDSLKGDAVNIISWEDLATRKRTSLSTKAQRLHSWIGASVERIILTVRRPEDMAVSLYTQSLRPLLKSNPTKPFVTFSDWFERNACRKTSPFMYQVDAVRAYVEVFGSERMEVLLYEELSGDQASFLSRVSSILGLPCLDVKDNGKVHRSLSARTVEFLSSARGSLGLDVGRIESYLDILESDLRDRLLAEHAAGKDVVPALFAALHDSLAQDSSYKPDLDPDSVRQMHGLLCPDFEWLQDRFELPLEQHSYFG